jgi:hypothetical protein
MEDRLYNLVVFQTAFWQQCKAGIINYKREIESWQSRDLD